MSGPITVIDNATAQIRAALTDVALVGALIAERRNGSRYCEALRGAREMRQRRWRSWWRICDDFREDSACRHLRAQGAPVGWITR